MLVVLALGASASAELSVLQRIDQLEARLAQMDKLEARVAQLEAENDMLRQSSVAVSPEGRVLSPEAGRRLSAAQCCRWTPDGTCGEVAAGRHRGCTSVHEYLEQKTTTHEFSDIDACLTAGNEGTWAASFDGVSSNVTLKSSGSAVTSFPTPLKVTHATQCASEAPLLTVQLDALFDGMLQLAGTIKTDVAEALEAAMGFKTTGVGVCTGTPLFTDVTQILAGEASGNAALNPPSVKALTWAQRGFHACGYECKFVSVSANGLVSAFAADQCSGVDGDATAVSFERAHITYTKFDQVACAGQNDIYESGDPHSLWECKAICDASTSCVSFEWEMGDGYDGGCYASSTCHPLNYDIINSYDNNYLYVKNGLV